MKKEIFDEHSRIQINEVNREKTGSEVDGFFELQEISIQPSLACNYGPGSSWCEDYTCN